MTEAVAAIALPWPDAFPDELEALARDHVASVPPPDASEPPIDVWTLDHVGTHDFDDAFSAEVDDLGNLWIGIWVTWAPSVLPETSALVSAAQERGASVYLPDRVIPMLPTCLCDEALSLAHGATRTALGLRFRATPDGGGDAWQVGLHTVRVRDNLLFGAESVAPLPWNALFTWGDTRRAARNRAGAVLIPRLRARPRWQGDPATLRLEFQERDDAAHRLIEELMVLYNERLALYCVEHEVPCVFRSSEPHRNPDRVSYWRQHPDAALARAHAFRHLGRVVLDTRPAPHFAVGIDAYTQLTSPLRRFGDLMGQFTLARHFAGQPPATAEAVMQAHRAAERGAEVGRRVTREAERAAFALWVAAQGDRTWRLLLPRPAKPQTWTDAVIEELDLPCRIRPLRPAAQGDRVVARFRNVEDATGALLFLET